MAAEVGRLLGPRPLLQRPLPQRSPDQQPLTTAADDYTGVHTLAQSRINLTLVPYFSTAARCTFYLCFTIQQRAGATREDHDDLSFLMDNHREGLGHRRLSCPADIERGGQEA